MALEDNVAFFKNTMMSNGPLVETDDGKHADFDLPTMKLVTAWFTTGCVCVCSGVSFLRCPVVVLRYPLAQSLR